VKVSTSGARWLARERGAHEGTERPRVAIVSAPAGSVRINGPGRDALQREIEGQINKRPADRLLGF
jgi:hypothetical protein